jgi:hypothetical protein
MEEGGKSVQGRDMINELTRCREIRRAIWAGLAMDLVDMGSIALSIGMGTVGKTTGVLLWAAALGTIGLGTLGLRGL